MATLTTYFYDLKILEKVSVEILELGLKTGEAPSSHLPTALVYDKENRYYIWP